jgi:hypothetical protein
VILRANVPSSIEEHIKMMGYIAATPTETGVKPIPSRGNQHLETRAPIHPLSFQRKKLKRARRGSNAEPAV